MSMLGLREIGIADPRGIREIVDARFNDIFKAKDL